MGERVKRDRKGDEEGGKRDGDVITRVKMGMCDVEQKRRHIHHFEHQSRGPPNTSKAIL